MNWEEMVRTANTCEAYHAIVCTLFEDGVHSEGRLKVLAYYTEDVCICHPHIASEIQQEYNKFLSNVKSKSMEQSRCCIL